MSAIPIPPTRLEWNGLGKGAYFAGLPSRELIGRFAALLLICFGDAQGLLVLAPEDGVEPHLGRREVGHAGAHGHDHAQVAPAREADDAVAHGGGQDSSSVAVGDAQGVLLRLVKNDGLFVPRPRGLPRAAPGDDDRRDAREARRKAAAAAAAAAAADGTCRPAFGG